MKQALKNTGYLFTACALSLALHSCSGTTTTTTTSDSTNSNAITIDTTTHPDTTTAVKRANTDSTFLVDVAQANYQELQMLEAGATQGSNKTLKTTAKKMIDDHRKLNAEMGDYAAKKHIQLSTDTAADMSAMNGMDEYTFDTAWTQKMIDGHQQTIAKFEAALGYAKDPELRSWITATLPALHQHLDMCTTLMAELNNKRPNKIASK